MIMTDNPDIPSGTGVVRSKRMPKRYPPNYHYCLCCCACKHYETPDTELCLKHNVPIQFFSSCDDWERKIE